MIRNLYCYQSFSSQNSRSTTNEPSAEQKLFSERWNTVISDPSYSAASVPPCRAIEFRPIRSLDILFILPFLGKNCGGVKVVLQLLERLYLLGYSCSILCEGKIDWEFVDKTLMVKPYTSKAQLHDEVSDIKNVIYSYFGDYSLSKASTSSVFLLPTQR